MAKTTPYRPPFTVTPKAMVASADIMRLVGRYEGLTSPRPEPKLRRQNQIRTILSSLAIEGNTLGIEQATAILEKKTVIGPKREILEVENAILAYGKASDFDPTKSKDLLRAHGLMMKGLAEDAGKYRAGGVGIFKGAELAHMAPPAKQVPLLVDQVLHFLKTDRETYPLIQSAVVHYELEFIHPFSDGNGRLGRLWQHIVLLRIHPLFEYVPVESVIHERQDEYYRVLRECDKRGDSSLFIEFALSAVHSSLESFLSELRPERQTAESRLAVAREEFKGRQFSRKDYLALLKVVSTATASRDLRDGVEQGLLVKEGTKAVARYRFRGGR